MINDSVGMSSMDNAPFCRICGKSTIRTDVHCGQGIRGRYQNDYVIAVIDTQIPAFCEKCGKPYPWMEENYEQPRELVEELPGCHDKVTLKGDFVYYNNKQALSELAIHRTKRMLSKLIKTV